MTPNDAKDGMEVSSDINGPTKGFQTSWTSASFIIFSIGPDLKFIICGSKTKHKLLDFCRLCG
jgi:hypothetical protein